MKVGWLNLGLLVNIRFSNKCSTCSLRETPDLLKISWNLVISQKDSMAKLPFPPIQKLISIAPRERGFSGDSQEWYGCRSI